MVYWPRCHSSTAWLVYQMANPNTMREHEFLWPVNFHSCCPCTDKCPKENELPVLLQTGAPDSDWPSNRTTRETCQHLCHDNNTEFQSLRIDVECNDLFLSVSRVRSYLSGTCLCLSFQFSISAWRFLLWSIFLSYSLFPSGSPSSSLSLGFTIS